MRICALLGLVVISGTVRGYGMTGKILKAAPIGVVLMWLKNRTELEKNRWFRIGMWGCTAIGGLLIVALMVWHTLMQPTH